ncbi:hypothetical protein ACH5RR_036727 [Cinchona calisaya]|uniref:Zinc finger GRF-type domain-containing protein n=1 Tax=Cinchona calisaya TaxID=153742 RepID=A0ABD2Y9H3_9GENT
MAFYAGSANTVLVVLILACKQQFFCLASCNFHRTRVEQINRLHNPSLDEKLNLLWRANLVTSWKDDNPGRRFLSCLLWQSGRGCGFFEWYDPVMSQRSRVIIPGLLRK